MAVKIVTENRKARHEYHILETFEAGLVLSGTEVKSLRAGKANLQDSYARVDNGELMLYNMHISPYEQGNRFNLEPKRIRKLLMHKQEIMRLLGELNAALDESAFALGNIAPGEIIVTGPALPNGALSVQFTGRFADLPVQNMVMDSSGLQNYEVVTNPHWTRHGQD